MPLWPTIGTYNKVYEFFAQDIGGNYFGAIYDFAWEEKAQPGA